MNLAHHNPAPKLKVLAVEDDPAVRHIVSSQLTALGYEVTAVGTGKEALDRLSLDDSFALLFTDVVLPGGLSGVELTRRVRHAFGPAFRVLLTSGYPKEVFEQHGTPDPDIRLLQKPYRRADLARAIMEALTDDGSSFPGPPMQKCRSVGEEEKNAPSVL